MKCGLERGEGGGGRALPGCLSAVELRAPPAPLTLARGLRPPPTPTPPGPLLTEIIALFKQPEV